MNKKVRPKNYYKDDIKDYLQFACIFTHLIISFARVRK